VGRPRAPWIVVFLIGLAVGVDYALFYLRRMREERAAGRSNEAALEAAAATSGRAVLVSGVTVMLAMAGMYLSGAPTFASFATGTIVVVAVAMLGSLTVLPAVLSKVGHRTGDRPARRAGGPRHRPGDRHAEHRRAEPSRIKPRTRSTEIPSQSGQRRIWRMSPGARAARSKAKCVDPATTGSDITEGYGGPESGCPLPGSASIRNRRTGSAPAFLPRWRGAAGSTKASPEPTTRGSRASSKL
jgi:hypothetical protein